MYEEAEEQHCRSELRNVLRKTKRAGTVNFAV